MLLEINRRDEALAVVLRQGLSVGAMSAEDDGAYLRESFVSTGALDELADTNSPKCIVLGRTGSGKSALLISLADSQENVIQLDPESLSLNYISNSDILRFFDNIGIDLDVFYQLLWRHVLAVEIIKAKKQLNDETISKNWIANLRQRILGNPKKEKALNYLFEYGSSFWADTEERVREVVTRIEKDFQDHVGLDVTAFKARIVADMKDGNLESVQETKEIINKAQRVVNNVQLQELNEVMNLLSQDIFNDAQERYYIIVDDLDTGWVHDSLRFKLIRALVETIKKFRRVRNLKIVISLRLDLLETVLQNTTAAGFQQEKYEDMYLRIRWNESELKELADKRISLLFKKQYTKDGARFSDVFSKRVGESDTFSYIYERTLQRPRDIIAFINECLEAAAGQSSVNHRVVRRAEDSYSAKRLASLADEWREAYGDLEEVLECLSKVEPRFKYDDISDHILEEACINIVNADGSESKVGLFKRQCDLIVNNQSSWPEVRRDVLRVLYLIGAIGFKSRDGAPYEWSFANQPTLQLNKVSIDTTFAIHPMLFKALGKYTDPRRLIPS
ncbi:P-loop ATPase, Sll1717 family [Sphingosinithalassobacter sp. LHW66-3]|uniref:P-loop ATPase, Sll1717 family n=1 Tax=Sphingosinithalassobacter sp. LHW66-3 TaxID=3424718 RepID=UPI003D6AB7C3